MNWQHIENEARKKFKGYCRVCKECNGIECAGEVPGMGGVDKGNSFINNIEALKKIKINLRTIHGAKVPNTETEILGHKLSLPVLAAPMTGVSYNMGGALSESEFLNAIIEGSSAAGSLGMTGDGAAPEMYRSGVNAIEMNEGKGIPVVKPREHKEIIKYISKAEEAGAAAVGIDIDGAGLVTMALKGQPVSPKSTEELKEIINSTDLPFVLKGIMTPDEAVKAVETGASAIVVSNHGGRVIDYTPGAAEVIPEIVEAVGGEITILADGGVRSGIDVLKYLALGADAVLVGRPMAVAVYGGGSEAVKFYLENIKNELYKAMMLTGCAAIGDINEKVIYQY